MSSAPPTGGAAAYMEALAYALLTYNMAYTRPRLDEMHIDATPPAPLGRTHHPSLVLLQNYQLLIPYVHILDGIYAYMDAMLAPIGYTWFLHLA